MIYKKSKNIKNPRTHGILIPTNRHDILNYRRLAGCVIYWLEENIGVKKVEWDWRVSYRKKSIAPVGITVKFSTEEDAMAFMLRWS